MNKHIYQMPLEDILKEYDVKKDQGLSEAQVKESLEKHGPNELDTGEKVSPLKIFLHNVNNIIVYLLLAAAIVSFITGETLEGFAVLVAVFIAVFFGFIVELRAQKSVESLKEMMTSEVKVIRDGSTKTITSDKLVPGDILYIEEGDPITADARLISSSNFSTQEAALTGESEPIDKDPEEIFDEEMDLGDQINMVFSGTAATRGNTYAVVTATGMESEMGKISDLLKDGKKEDTPLNKELDKLGKLLIVFAGIAAILVIILGMIQGQEITALIQTAIILAVAAIPEAMPAVSTITLARGMNRMAEYQALVKSLPAVETLGSTSVICSDKTGTITENEMTVVRVALLNEKVYTVTGTGLEEEGDFLLDDEPVNVEDEESLTSFIQAGINASNASLEETEDGLTVVGDPTEGALLILSRKAGIDRTSWDKAKELPFSSKHKNMAVSFEKEGEQKNYIKGAPDVLLADACNSEEELAYLKKKNDELADEGMRVLAIGELEDLSNITEEKLIKATKSPRVLGLVGIMDPPREDVKEAIECCHEAGVSVVMITGDHPRTAKAIASKTGILEEKDVLSGSDLKDMSTEELEERIEGVRVFARVTPEHKLNIIKALKEKGHTVAMTGDGVNDAPALNGADIGIAMGIRGTEVAKEASDMILTDDRFSTIVDAIREGRNIFNNIKKFVYFLFSCNFVEITTVLLTVLFFLPMPLLPLHILWLNLVIDIFPAVALSFEPSEEGVMKEKPRKAGEGLIAKSFLLQILISGLVLGTTSFIVFRLSFNGDNLAYARTMTFTAMALLQMLHTFNVRRQKSFGLDRSLLKNKPLLGALVIALGLQLMAVYLPIFNNVMETTPLNLLDWAKIIGYGVVATFVVWLLKKLFGRFINKEK